MGEGEKGEGRTISKLRVRGQSPTEWEQMECADQSPGDERILEFERPAWVHFCSQPSTDRAHVRKEPETKKYFERIKENNECQELVRVPEGSQKGPNGSHNIELKP